MSISKATKIFLFVIFLGLVSACLYLGYKYFVLSTTGKQFLSLSGVVKRGKDISPQKDYCPDELYIVTEDKTYQIRTPDKINVRPTVYFSKFQNSTVKIKATYTDVKPNCNSLSPDCNCDPFILVTNIKSIKRPDNSFQQYSGVINCLPIKEGETPIEICALGLIADNGKNYVLKNIPDELVITGKRLVFTGEEDKGGISGPYKIDALLNVVEIKN